MYRFSILVDCINEYDFGGEIPKKHYLRFYENLIMKNIVAIDKDKSFYQYALCF